ncbi:hypothetical protein BGZ72_002709 [Mortierella alpina]|nr:hypothetical protein BGZ72_002709 [Mortierella alpina]
MHLDEAPNEEQSHVHEARSTVRSAPTTSKELSGELAKMKQQSQQGQTSINRITKVLHQVFALDTADKARLVQGFRSRAGIVVCEYRSEADTCIARMSITGPRVVATGDSDLMIYRNINRVLRAIPRTNDFGWYKKDDMLRTSGLPSTSHLVLLVIVLNNDYSSNIRALGIVTNCNIIRQIPLPPDGDIDVMLEDYVAAAQAKVKETSQQIEV